MNDFFPWIAKTKMKIKIKGCENYELYDTGDVFNTITEEDVENAKKILGI